MSFYNLYFAGLLVALYGGLSGLYGSLPRGVGTVGMLSASLGAVAGAMGFTWDYIGMLSPLLWGSLGAVGVCGCLWGFRCGCGYLVPFQKPVKSL